MGYCRTGTFWAFQNAQLTPDIASTAKALANGLPMGAMMAKDEVARAFVAGSHATTFGGGAITSKVAAKVIEIMVRDNLAKRAKELGDALAAKLAACMNRHPEAIKSVRHRGLMLGIDVEDCPNVWQKLIHRGYICGLTHGTTLRLLPALTIEEDELFSFVDALDGVLSE